MAKLDTATYRTELPSPTPDPNTGTVIRSAMERIKALPPPDPASLTTSDGAVTFEIGDDGEVYEAKAPAVHRPRTDRFDENLAETVPEPVLQDIAQDYAEGVDQDIVSRSEFIANRDRGIDLLGLKIEAASAVRSGQSISKVKHPALLKACLKSRAGACAELLPAGGPCKVATIGGSTSAEDERAKSFQDDFNYYLTDVAKEFYPDTRRAMFYRAFDGSVYKKIYRHPLKRRPVSESVYMPDLIVGEDALDLSTAQRKTNEIVMWPMQARRMMMKGGWRDIALAPSQDMPSPSRQKEAAAMGFSSASRRPEDKPYTFWEGYIWLIGEESGLTDHRGPADYPLPYRIVIEKYSKQVMALHRNWKPKDEDFKERELFVKYGLVPGLGFLDYGMVHLIGNSTRVLTTILQIMCDRGMLANFPGGVKVKGLKTETNELNPGLGEFVSAQLPDGMTSIKDALMGMPYGDLSAIFIQLMESVAQDVEQLAGTVEIEIGENRTNVPVGTILAMVEQQTQAQSDVHRADHQAQKQELALLRDLFLENPEDLRWLTRKGGREWKAVEEFADMDLVPVSDPNVPSQTHRVMLNMALMDMAKQAPMLFMPKLPQLAEKVGRGFGINDIDSLLPSPQQWQAILGNLAKGRQGPGQAAMVKTQMELPLKAKELQIADKKLDLEQQVNQREAADQMAQHAERQQELQTEAVIEGEKAAQARAELAAEERRSAVAENVDPLAAATLRKTDAQTLAALGSAAMGFAKAGETMQQGEAEVPGAINTVEGASASPTPSPRSGTVKTGGKPQRHKGAK